MESPTWQVDIHAIMVAVDYADLLALTLPWNRHQFASVTIVTSPKDMPTVGPLAAAHFCAVHVTERFWQGGAAFNKWAALEEAFDYSPTWRGRLSSGKPRWTCIMDADVAWPKDGVMRLARLLRPGFLYTPRRRMMPSIPAAVPPEEDWATWPHHRNEAEFAGYSQVFRSDDPVLGPPPWHQIDWKHAGGADSFFQAKWPRERKVRPPFDVLHFGPAGVNWMGRASAYADGTKPAEADDRKEAMFSLFEKRRERKRWGKDQYGHEKIG